MKLLSILIAFALVNVLAANLEQERNYVEQAVITNRYIDITEDQLPAAIKTIVHTQAFSITKIANMVAIPEYEHKKTSLNVKTRNQMEMQAILWNLSNKQPPKLNQDNFIYAGNFEMTELLNLGIKRREKTRPVVKAMIGSILSKGCVNEDFPDISVVCRLVELFRFINDPNSYPKFVDEQNGVCYIRGVYDKDKVCTYVCDGRDFLEIDNKGSTFGYLSEHILKEIVEIL